MSFNSIFTFNQEVLAKTFNKSVGGVDATSNLNLVGDSSSNEIKK